MRVLVTRPEPGASRTAARLAALGHEAFELPLTRTVGLPVPPADLPRADAVVVTSANALRFLPKEILPRLANNRLYAVGTRTADAARVAGFAEVIEGPGDAIGLARTIARAAAPASKLVYPCGRVRLPAFEIELAKAGFSVVPVETYDAIAIEWTDAGLANVLGPHAIDAVLLYSAVAASAFRALATRSGVQNQFAGVRVLCLSARVAEALGPVSGKLGIAATPDEDALFALLRG